MIASIFFDFSLPNATSWFYFSLFLVVGLFFKFTRILSVRNWDLLALFLLVPGFLLLQEAYTLSQAAGAAGADGGIGAEREAERAYRLLFVGYVWLLAGTGYWVLRCLADLALVRRPALGTNMNFGGLAWIAGFLFVCLTTVALRENPEQPFAAAPSPLLRTGEGPGQVGKGPMVLEKVQEGAAAMVPVPRWDEERAERVRFWVSRGAAVACHLAILVGLIVIGRAHFQDTTLGMAAGALYLLLPYTAYHASQAHHLWPAALLVWAVAAYRRPRTAGALLGVAAGTAFFPLLLFPLWLGFYRGRGARPFAAGFLTATALSLALAVGMLLLDGRLAENLAFVLSLSDWQPWRIPEAESIWSGAHWAYRMPVFIAYAGLVVVTAVWPSPKNLAHLVALSAALLLGVQFWYADRGGVYVLWYLPLLTLMVFRPNLTAARPPAEEPGMSPLHRGADRPGRRAPLPGERVLVVGGPDGFQNPQREKAPFSGPRGTVRVFPTT